MRPAYRWWKLLLLALFLAGSLAAMAAYVLPRVRQARLNPPHTPAATDQRSDDPPGTGPGADEDTPASAP